MGDDAAESRNQSHILQAQVDSRYPRRYCHRYETLLGMTGLYAYGTSGTQCRSRYTTSRLAHDHLVSRHALASTKCEGN
eukprot:scaffold126839_cov25-Prasinocladus_malaysianus.AAC.1